VTDDTGRTDGSNAADGSSVPDNPSSASITLRVVDSSASYAAAERLLSRNDLPSGDLRGETDTTSTPATLWLAVETAAPPSDGTVESGESHSESGDIRAVGVGGLEQYGTVGLVRSVAVRPERHGEGYGTSICDAVERRAASRGVETLYLLTTTAAAFFEQRGYEPVARSDAPEAIRETTQFTSLCPDAAACLRKRLDE
jgi:amino-acid N-acetyltransferase